jgi:hypothetical protein
MESPGSEIYANCGMKNLRSSKYAGRSRNIQYNKAAGGFVVLNVYLRDYTFLKKHLSLRATLPCTGLVSLKRIHEEKS